MIKVKATHSNPYHRPGQVIDTDETTAKHLVEKGYAEYEEDADKKEKSAIEKAIDAISKTKTVKALEKLAPADDAPDEVKDAYTAQMSLLK